MEFLIKSILKTADIADGWTVGTMVIENQQGFIQLDSGAIIPAAGIVEVKNGDSWQRLIPEDYCRVTVEGWPAYAGLDARMRQNSHKEGSYANDGPRNNTQNTSRRVIGGAD